MLKVEQEYHKAYTERRIYLLSPKACF